MTSSFKLRRPTFSGCWNTESFSLKKHVETTQQPPTICRRWWKRRFFCHLSVHVSPNYLLNSEGGWSREGVWFEHATKRTESRENLAVMWRTQTSGLDAANRMRWPHRRSQHARERTSQAEWEIYKWVFPYLESCWQLSSWWVDENLKYCSVLCFDSILKVLLKARGEN